MNLSFINQNYIISIISLCYVIILAKYNTINYDKKYKFYIAACVCTILTIVLEIVDRYLSSLNGYYIVHMNILVNVLGFLLIPVISIILILSYYNGDKKLYNFLIFFPVILYSVVCVLSVLNGYVFSIDANNVYTRGPLFSFSIIIGIIYFVVLILIIGKSTIDYGIEERIFIWSIFLIVALSSLVQVVLKDIYILWSAVSLSLVLYYIYLREIQIKYDPITNIKNRFAYESDIKKHRNHDKIGIVMFDLNNLKFINDNNGHYNGDKVIKDSAHIIRDCFKGLGIPYRIGGDEFCVICKDSSSEMIEKALSQLTIEIAEANNRSDIKIGLAFGYSAFDNKCKSIYDVINQADMSMYRHKAIMKKQSI